MRTLVAMFFLLCNILVYADTITMRDGVKAWIDREYLISKALFYQIPDIHEFDEPPINEDFV